MDIIGGKLVRNETNENAKGGTEIIATALSQKLDSQLLSKVQIVNSRVRELQSEYVRIFVAHDLPGDPESEFLKTQHDLFHRYVFVSNWQMMQYIAYYKLPWEKCCVIQNAIEPFNVDGWNKGSVKNKDSTIRLAYWSTPHRGLDILVPVFQKLCEKYGNIELDVYSSYKLYGWGDRDQAFEDLFETCRRHPKINYMGTVDNDTIRNNLLNTDILAYPSTWLETSCLVLIEAMSAGLLCVHPNFGALPETAAGLTEMYQWSPDKRIHAEVFYNTLDKAIATIDEDKRDLEKLELQIDYSKKVYSWTDRVKQWNTFLAQTIEQVETERRVFTYTA